MRIKKVLSAVSLLLMEIIVGQMITRAHAVITILIPGNVASLCFTALTNAPQLVKTASNLSLVHVD